MSKEKYNQTESFFEFPCQFPVKIMANPKKEVIEFVISVFKEYVLDNNQIDLRKKESKTGKYISLTIIFTASSKSQLDKIYRKISSHTEVHMVL